MNIEFTKEQYEKLLKAFYIGNLVIHSDEEYSEEDDDFEKLQAYLFSKAPEVGLECCVSVEDGETYPSKEFEFNEEIAEYINDYDDTTFWHELCDRLGQKDVLKEIGEEALAEMDPMTRMLIVSGMSDKYDDFFMEHGLDVIDLDAVDSKKNFAEVKKIVDDLMEKEVFTTEDS